MSAPALALPGEVSITIPLTAGWELASTTDPASLTRPEGLRFVPATVPGTVASALRDHQAWRMGDGVRFDEAHYLFRCRFDAEPAGAQEEIVLRLAGIATIAEVRLNGERILASSSMFASHELNVSALIRDRNELLIACYPLAAALRERRGCRPAARWRNSRRQPAAIALVSHDAARPGAGIFPRTRARRALAPGDFDALPPHRPRSLVASGFAPWLNWHPRPSPPATASRHSFPAGFRPRAGQRVHRAYRVEDGR